MPQSRKHNAWNEVIGLVLLGVGTVLFLALISYTPKDVPSWVWFSSISPPNNPAQNFIGPTGAVIAGFLYMTLGSASYLIATILLGFGGAKLFLPGFRILRAFTVGRRLRNQWGGGGPFAALVSARLEARFQYHGTWGVGRLLARISPLEYAWAGRVDHLTFGDLSHQLDMVNRDSACLFGEAIDPELQGLFPPNGCGVRAPQDASLQ